MTRGALPESSKYFCLAETKSMVENGQLIPGRNVLEYSYRMANGKKVKCLGDVCKTTYFIISRGIVLKPGENEAKVDEGFLEYLRNKKYEELSDGIFSFGSFSKFACAYCRYYSKNNGRRTNGLDTIKQFGLSMNQLKKGVSSEHKVPITLAYSSPYEEIQDFKLNESIINSVKASAKPQRKRVPKKKKAHKKRTTVKTRNRTHKKQTAVKERKKSKKKRSTGKSEVNNEEEGQVIFKITPDSNMKDAEKIIKNCLKLDDFETWEENQQQNATETVSGNLEVLRDGLIAVFDEDKEIGKKYENLSKSYKRKCFDDGLQNKLNVPILEAPKKRQRLDLRAKEIYMQFRILKKGVIVKVSKSEGERMWKDKVEAECEAPNNDPNDPISMDESMMQYHCNSQDDISAISDSY